MKIKLLSTKMEPRGGGNKKFKKYNYRVKEFVGFEIMM
jgi:hypothetical protein